MPTILLTSQIRGDLGHKAMRHREELETHEHEKRKQIHTA